MKKHIFVTPADPDHHCRLDSYCMVCEGGLALCKVCGGLEGGLTSDCPGEIVEMDKLEAVHKGEVDFVGGKWVNQASPHSPAYYRERLIE